MSNRMPALFVDCSYRGVVLHHDNSSGEWKTESQDLPGKWATLNEVMIAIDRMLDEARRVSVPVIVRGSWRGGKGETTIIDGDQVWVMIGKRRSKERIKECFFADKESQAEYKKRDEAVEAARAVLTKALEHRDSLHVTAESLIARHKEGKADGKPLDG